MRPIHPFPARMAPDTVADWLAELPVGSHVLDPMCGSGVVVRQSLLSGHKATGIDLDPLAVLMSTVWTQSGPDVDLLAVARSLIQNAKARPHFTYLDLPWVAGCKETQLFIEYWFSEPQRSHLASLAWELGQNYFSLPDSVLNIMKIALSKIIVTKQAGASLAWDVSHSRPHKKRIENDYSVFEGYIYSVTKLCEIIKDNPIGAVGDVRRGDCRKIPGIGPSSIDAVITSPPYLNAIDYLRGHKFSLIWLGYTIPELRNIRSSSIGTEKASIQGDGEQASDLDLAVPEIVALPLRQRNIVYKYAVDANLFLREMKRVLKPSALLVLVLGDSCVRGVPVYNSRIFRHMAEKHGFKLHDERQRPIQSNKRYLPITSDSASLAKRMNTEVLQSYHLGSST